MKKIQDYKKILKEEGELPLDIDITAVDTKPVGSQDPSHDSQAGVETIPTGEGNEKTPDSKETNLENPVGGAPQEEVIVKADGPQDAPVKATSETDATVSAETAKTESITINGKRYKLIKEDEQMATLGTVIEPQKEEPKFIMYDGSPRAVLNDLGETVELLYDANTGETKTVNKNEVKEFMGEKVMKTAKQSKGRKVYEASEDVMIGKNYLLEKGDKFIVISEEEEKKDDEKKEDKPEKIKKEEPKEPEKKEESININGKRYRLVSEEAQPDKNGKYPFEDGYIKPEDDKKDKEEDKKEESFKNKKVYTVEEDVMIGKEVLLEKGDRFVVISEDEEKKEEPKEEKPEEKKEADKEEVKESKQKRFFKVKEKTDEEKMEKVRAAKEDGEKKEEPKEDKKEESITINGKRYKKVTEEDEEKKDDEKEKETETKVEEPKEDKKEECEK